LEYYPVKLTFCKPGSPWHYKVNKAVTFNIIKHQAIDILLNPKQDSESKIQKLTILFKTAAIPIRKNRNPPRKKTSYARSYNFQLRKKKHVY
jgi:hypothetical protein